ncbi:MAG: hypothetical protein JNN28_21105 [Saprospiraceae bacterium]|nr:hypothetical protein [Saprospiraceae bacterium]
MTRYLFGPELFWMLMYLGAGFLGKANQPPTKGMDDFIETLWFWIPAVSMLVFGLWWLPSVEKNWLLLRVWVVGIVGGHLVMEKALSAYSNQGPGIGMGYLAGMMLLFLVLVVGSVVVKIWG